MSYNFQPLSDEELNSYNLMDDGIYDFQVEKSTSKVSKSNNPMAELVLTVWDKSGRPHMVFDYLVFSQVALNIRKVKHFCDTVGLIEEYKNGQLREELASLCGKVEIGRQEKQPKQGGGFYPEKNVVVDYVTSDKDSSKVDHVKEEGFHDDELPF